MTPQLLLISDSRRFGWPATFNIAELACAAGVDAFMLREKDLDSARLLAAASELRAITGSYGARLLLHSQADVALAVGADGVHLAASEIATLPQLRAWLRAPSMSLSVSCHSSDELQRAAEVGADFALLSPVFPTATHPGAPALGAARFHELAVSTELPVVALGGIDGGNRQQLVGFGVAVIGAIFAAADPAAAARMLLAERLSVGDAERQQA